jgi:hypothetical protein
MVAVLCFSQIPAPNPRRTSSASSASSTVTVSRLSSLFQRSSVRPVCRSGDDQLQQKPSRTVSWDTHVEIFSPSRRSVSWTTHVEVFIIPARECAPNDCDPRFKSTARDHAPDDCDPRLKSFDDDERVTTSSCEDDTLTPCALFSDDPNGLQSALETKRARFATIHQTPRR